MHSGESQGLNSEIGDARGSLLMGLGMAWVQVSVVGFYISVCFRIISGVSFKMQILWAPTQRFWLSRGEEESGNPHFNKYPDISDVGFLQMTFQEMLLSIEIQQSDRIRRPLVSHSGVGGKSCPLLTNEDTQVFFSGDLFRLFQCGTENFEKI